MNQKEYQGLKQIASEQVPLGIYAIEKDDYAELMNIKCEDVNEVKARAKQFQKEGFLVVTNDGV